MNRFIISIIVALSVAPACINDQESKFDDFIERSEPFRATADVLVCSERFDVSGDYLITLATHLQPDNPILLNATFSVDTTSWTISCDFHLIDHTNRTDVGELYSASADVAEDGSFTLDFGAVDVPAAANPITFSDIQAELVLVGCTKSADLACGAIEGKVVTPEIDLATSTWGSARVDGDITAAPAVPDCAAGAAL